MRHTLLATLAFLTLMSVAQAADMGVAPSRVDVTVAPGQTVTEVLHVFWTGSEPIDVRPSVTDWTMSPEGKVIFLGPGDNRFSATPWVTIDSQDLQIAVASEAQLRVTVAVPNDPKYVGTYNSVILLTGPPTVSSGSGTHVGTRQQLGVILYVTVEGTARTGSKLSDMYVDAHTLHLVVDNSGNTLMRLAGSVEIRNASGTTVQTLVVPDSPILRDSERELALPVPSSLASGYYVLLALLKDSRGGLLTGQLPYEVP